MLGKMRHFGREGYEDIFGFQSSAPISNCLILRAIPERSARISVGRVLFVEANSYKNLGSRRSGQHRVHDHKIVVE